MHTHLRTLYIILIYVLLKYLLHQSNWPHGQQYEVLYHLEIIWV